MAALTVLVVEDDAIIAMLLGEMLGEIGYRVCAIAATEEDAVAAAARCNPGLMIVDEQLRQGTGSSAVARILRGGPVPCVFISGAPVTRTESHTMMLRKPFLMSDLTRMIQNAVGDNPTPQPRFMAGFLERDRN